MSKLGSVNENANLNNISLNTNTEGAGVDKKIKDKVSSITHIDNIESVKPEGVGHKAGRIIAGILGGLLLAAGIAAAVVATTASFGVAAGILGTVAAFTGITGASIAAGTAGTAGIALITTSALLAPKHLQDTPVPVETKEPNQAEGSKQIEGSKQKVEISEIITGKYKTILKTNIDTENKSLKSDTFSLALALSVSTLARDILKDANLSAEKVTDEGIAAVRNALKQCGEIFKADKELGSYVEIFNNQDVRENLVECLQNAMGKISREEDKVFINTIISALLPDDEPEPQAQPQNVILG